MTAIVMQCVKAEQHPNADALKLYSFEAPTQDPIQIVANLEHVYEVGDLAIIVLAGSVMKDGTKIKPTKLRGVQSYGMALGHATGDVGDDLSDEYCQPPSEQMKRGAQMIPWPDIESLFNVRRGLKAVGEERAITYRGKIKLDGTNAGVQLFPDGRIVPQSRSRILDPDSDNMNFAKWVVPNYSYFEQVRQRANENGYDGQHLTIFGEWCGKKIQSRTAISKIDRQIFAVFAMQIDPMAKLETDPDKLRAILPEHKDVFVIPWYGEDMLFDFTDLVQLERQAEKLNEIVSTVEKCDPFVRDTFGISGLGEGVVMYPIIGGSTQIDRMTYSDLVFKAKGEKHKVVNSKKPVQIDPEFVATIDKFVELFVTENRLEQIAQKVLEGKDPSPALTGPFIKAFSQDVMKESKAELETSGLEWKQVAKAINSKAVGWWKVKCDNLS